MYLKQSWELEVQKQMWCLLLLLLCLCLFSIIVYSRWYWIYLKIVNVTYENVRYEKQVGIKHEGLWCSWQEVCSWLTDWLTLTHCLTFTLRQANWRRTDSTNSSKPQEKLACDDAMLSFLLLLAVIFIPQLRSNKHQPLVFFCPHPSLLTPSNFLFHPPPHSSLGDSPCLPFLHNPKHTSAIHPPNRLPFSTAAAKNKTGWCGGLMGEAPRWWSSASPAWALTPLNSSTWLCLFNIQSAVGSGVSHSL